MGRLRLYKDESGRCAIHESGFSWLAGASLLLWALRRRLYLVAALALALNVGLGFVVAWLALGDAGQLALGAFLFVGIGALARPLHRRLLERAGWRLVAEEPPPGGGTPS